MARSKISVFSPRAASSSWSRVSTRFGRSTNARSKENSPEVRRMVTPVGATSSCVSTSSRKPQKPYTSDIGRGSRAPWRLRRRIALRRAKSSRGTQGLAR